MHLSLPSRTTDRSLARRRLVLLASAASIAGALVLAGPHGYGPLTGAALVTRANATEMAGPAGFADMVQRVKPAVVSVRVKLKSGCGQAPIFRSDDAVAFARFALQFHMV